MTAPKEAFVSEKGRAVFSFLVSYHKQHGVAPSVREIGTACNIVSTSLVASYLGQLERAGWIKRYAKVPRGIVILGETTAN